MKLQISVGVWTSPSYRRRSSTHPSSITTEERGGSRDCSSVMNERANKPPQQQPTIISGSSHFFTKSTYLYGTLYNGKDGCLNAIVNDYSSLKYGIGVFVRLQEKSCLELVPIRPVKPHACLVCTSCLKEVIDRSSFISEIRRVKRSEMIISMYVLNIVWNQEVWA